MSGFVVRRLAASLAVMLALSVLIFLIFFATPGVDPARNMAGKNPKPETIAAIEQEFGLDKPLPVQYWRTMKALVIDRDLESYSNRGVEVIPEIFSAVPVTLSLVFGATVVWLLGSVLLGTFAALKRGSIWDRLLLLVALVSLSLPAFWLGQVVNIFTQDLWHDTFLFSWVPPLGYTPLAEDPVLWFERMLIPWFVLGALLVGIYGRVLRSALIESESQEFVRTARAKGISQTRVLIRHQLRTSLSAYLSLFALDFGALVGGGALLVEVVFGLPGMGRLTYNALQSLDLPVVMGTVLYAAFFIVLMTALIDILQARLDPRAREA